MFCSDNAAQRAYQDGLDEDAAYAERLERSVEHHSDLIRGELTKAFECQPHAIPFLRSRLGGVIQLLGSEHVRDTLLDDVLHNAEIWAAFESVLQKSTCEHVQALKGKITKQVIEDRASDIAKWDCEQ